MAERQVTIDGQTLVLPLPFLVLATENPIEFEGVFPLPEAQLDRFFLKARLGYPGEEDELAVVLDQQGGHPLERLRPAVGRRRARPARGRARRGLRRRPRSPVDDPARTRNPGARRARDRRLGAGQPRARARLARVGAPLRARVHDPRGRRADVRPGARAPVRVLADLRRRISRALPRGDPAGRLPPLHRARPPTRFHVEVDAAELSFPLVPRWRPVGSAFGRLRAARRGIGSSVAGTRPYRPGDDPSLIDWKLSARLSSLRGEADFVVREDFADEAPRLVVLADRSPSMALYPEDLPWLSKPRALDAVWHAVSTTAVRELGLAGYLDTAAGESWFAPRSAVGFDAVEERQGAAAFDGEPDGLERAFERLAQTRRSLPPGTFVFVCSDFVRPLRPEVWLRALGFRWDLVPVVLQDPVWEQSFPPVGGLVVPFADPARGRVQKVRLSHREAETQRNANEARLERLLADFRSLGLDAVVVGDAAPQAVLAQFTTWAEARLANRRGEWR